MARPKLPDHLKRKIRSLRLSDEEMLVVKEYFTGTQDAIDNLLTLLYEYPKQVKQLINRTRNKTNDKLNS